MVLHLNLRSFSFIFLLPFILFSLTAAIGLYRYEEHNLEKTLQSIVEGDVSDLTNVISVYLREGKNTEIQSFLDKTLESHHFYSSLSLVDDKIVLHSTNRSLIGKSDQEGGLLFSRSDPAELFSGNSIRIPFTYSRDAISKHAFISIQFDHDEIYREVDRDLELLLFLAFVFGLSFYVVTLLLIHWIFVKPIRQLNIFSRGGPSPGPLYLEEFETLKEKLVSGFESMRKVNQELSEDVIKEKKKVEQSKDLLIQQSRLALLGEMFGIIAHQWRQPLNTLGLMVQDIPESVSSNEFDKKAAEDFSRRAMDQVLFMSKTIDDFRDLVRPIDPKDIRSFSPFAGIRDVLGLMEAQLKNRRIMMEHLIHSERVKEVSCTGFLNEFKHVIMNLLSNARNVIMEGRAAGFSGAGYIRIHQKIENNYYVCEVEDDGRGIPEDILGKIFDPYFTTRPGKGSGIGLYIVRIIIQERMEGEVSVSNTSDGARFTIRLPISKQDDSEEGRLLREAKKAKHPVFLD